MISKTRTYLKKNWKRLVVANLLGFAVQGVVLAVLCYVGVPTVAATVAAKGSSWILFGVQMVCGK